MVRKTDVSTIDRPPRLLPRQRHTYAHARRSPLRGDCRGSGSGYTERAWIVESGVPGRSSGLTANAVGFVLAALTLLLASSQGDSSFHLYGIQGRTHRHLGVFHVEGVSDTDGVQLRPGSAGCPVSTGFARYTERRGLRPSGRR
jgi:hypothetical protein